MGTRARCLAAAVSVAALVLAANAHPRGHRGGGWWYGPPAPYNSWTVRACLGTYHFQHSLLAYRYNVDHCFIEGRLTQVSQVIRGVLRQTHHWQTPVGRMKRHEWRICLNTYGRLEAGFTTPTCVGAKATGYRSQMCSRTLSDVDPNRQTTLRTTPKFTSAGRRRRQTRGS